MGSSITIDIRKKFSAVISGDTARFNSVAAVVTVASDTSLTHTTYRKNGAAVNLTNRTTDANANSIYVSDSDLYVGGYKQNTYDVEYTRYWKTGTRFF